MADVATELQKAIYTALTAPAFQTLIGEPVAVLDRVPGGQALPYIKIGDDQELGDLAQGYAGSETHCTIGVWALGPGKGLVKKIAGLIRATLCPDQRPGGAAPFTLPSHQLVTWTFESAQSSDDLDGVSVKAIVVISFTTYPTA